MDPQVFLTLALPLLGVNHTVIFGITTASEDDDNYYTGIMDMPVSNVTRHMLALLMSTVHTVYIDSIQTSQGSRLSRLFTLGCHARRV